MRVRHTWLVGMANAFSVCAVVVFISFTTAQIYRFREAITVPFGLPEEAVAITVRSPGYEPASAVAEMANEIVRLLSNARTVLVWVGPDFGIGVLDPTGFFAAEPLLEGTYFAAEAFPLGHPTVMVKKDSPVHRMVVDGATLVGGDVTRVKGVFDENHPLYTAGYSYVFSFTNATSLQGTYYFSGAADAVQAVLTLLNAQGYTVREHAVRENRASALRGALSPYYLATLGGLVFVFFNLFLAYHVVLSRHQHHFSLHRRFGATNGKLLRRLLASVLPAILVGSFGGVIAYAAVFRWSDTFALTARSGWTPIAALAVNLTASILLISAAYLVQCVGAAKAGQI